MIVGRETASRKVFNAFNLLLFTVINIVCLYPLWYILIQSFSDGAKATHALVFPVNFTLENYRMILSRRDIGHALMISILRTVSGASITVLACMMLVCTGASANSWGLSGNLYRAVEQSKAWEDYTILSNQEGPFAVMQSRYHHALFFVDDQGILHVYTTAVYMDNNANMMCQQNGGAL